MSNSWTQVFRGRASIYALDEDTKQWADRGASGTIIMFQNNSKLDDVRIKWERNNQELWWRLTSSKLKPKGERALVLKAWHSSSNRQEILAIRFSDQNAAIQFAKKYHNIFPLAIQPTYSIENIFQQQSSSTNSNNTNQQNGGKLNISFHSLPLILFCSFFAKSQKIVPLCIFLKIKGNKFLKPKSNNLSMVSLPASVLGDDESMRNIQMMQPNYGQNDQQMQYNDINNYQQDENNNFGNRNHKSQPPPPPRRNGKKAAPPPRPNGNLPNNNNGPMMEPIPENMNNNGNMSPINENQAMNMNIDYNYNNNNNQQYPQQMEIQNGRMSISDNKPLPEEPPPSVDNDDYAFSGKPRSRVVKADPNMKPWNRAKPNNESVELQFGGNQNGNNNNNNNVNINPNGSWKCAVCTYQNTENTAKCSMCGLPQNNKKPVNRMLFEVVFILYMYIYIYMYMK